jgi:hypothetical protein
MKWLQSLLLGMIAVAITACSDTSRPHSDFPRPSDSEILTFEQYDRAVSTYNDIWKEKMSHGNPREFRRSVLKGLLSIHSKEANRFALSIAPILGEPIPTETEISSEVPFSNSVLAEIEALTELLIWGNPSLATDEQKQSFDAWIDLMFVIITACPSDRCAYDASATIGEPNYSDYVQHAELTQSEKMRLARVEDTFLQRMVDDHRELNLSTIATISKMRGELGEWLHNYSRFRMPSHVELESWHDGLLRQARRAKPIDNSTPTQQMLSNWIEALRSGSLVVP